MDRAWSRSFFYGVVALCLLAGVMLLSGIGRLSAKTNAKSDSSSLAGVDITIDQVAASGFASPVHITHAGDGSGRLFVVEQPGRVQIVQAGTNALFLDITDRVMFGSERGLLSVAFPPGFASKGHFYVNYTRKPDGATVVARYHITANPNVADPNSEQVILTIAQPYANHNGGQLAFGPDDGYLYIGMGDGGSGGDPGNRAQNPESPLGKMLRIDVASRSRESAAFRSSSASPIAAFQGLWIIMNAFSGILISSHAQITTEAQLAAMPSTKAMTRVSRLRM